MVEQDLSDCAEPLCARPITLQFSGHGKPRDRLGPRGDETDGWPCHVLPQRRRPKLGDGVHLERGAILGGNASRLFPRLQPILANGDLALPRSPV